MELVTWSFPDFVDISLDFYCYGKGDRKKMSLKMNLNPFQNVSRENYEINQLKILAFEYFGKL